MPAPTFEGIFAVLITPLTETGDVDEDGVRYLVDFCCDQGFNGVVVLGSNGEFPYLSFSEKILVMRTAAEQANGRLIVVAGASASGTDQALAMAREAKNTGCHAVLAALPTYYKLDMDNILLHFRTLCDKSGIPILFYYFPDTTGLVLTSEQISMIADLNGVVGAKLTVTSVPFLEELMELTRDKEFASFTGMTLLFRECLQLGGAGVFCPLPLLGPGDARAIWEAHRAGDQSRSKEVQDKVLGALPFFAGIDLQPDVSAAIFNDLSKSPVSEHLTPLFASHIFIKEALRLQGHPITNMVKRPYLPATEAQSQLVHRTLKDLGWL
jgi:4-hydroxy-tetrahydrodipicolinate synthase